MSEKKIKPRAAKYDKPMKINGIFEQVIRVAVGKEDEVKKEIEEEKKSQSK